MDFKISRRKKRELKKEEFKKQIMLLSKRKKCPKRIRKILKLSYNKQSLPSIEILKEKRDNIKKRANKLALSYKLTKYIQDQTISNFGCYSSSEIVCLYFVRFRYRRLRQSPYLSESHKLQRLIWCLKHYNCDFKEYIFVDETTIRLFEPPMYHLRYPSAYPNAFPCTSKTKSKLNVWGGISFMGPTNLAVFTSNLDSILYREILAQNLLPFGAINYDFWFKLHQDNDPKHRSKICTNFLEKNNVYWTIIKEVGQTFSIKMDKSKK
ncbi:Transposable element Tcb2 transposase [Brachionus plicatilis]|uniref:Transposable element Tcb2 transposase n=1 Tax=Brachionus plicatilis TaxID=10195 RepID=A0A3M7QXP1_BRAPC|nr:Transposable element Tcb2 transposase [Brachionus plicatilis]